MKHSESQVVYERVRPLALFSVIIAGIALGALAHELVHVLLIPYATSITFHIGDPQVLFSTCCLKPGDYAFEELAFLAQFAVLVAWVFLNKDVWLEKVKIKV